MTCRIRLRQIPSWLAIWRLESFSTSRRYRILASSASFSMAGRITLQTSPQLSAFLSHVACISTPSTQKPCRVWITRSNCVFISPKRHLHRRCRRIDLIGVSGGICVFISHRFLHRSRFWYSGCFCRHGLTYVA